MTMDVISCKTTHDKLRWATSLCDRKHVGSVSATDIKTILILLDQVENNGFTDAPPQEEMDEMMFRFIFIIISNHLMLTCLSCFVDESWSHSGWWTIESMIFGNDVTSSRMEG